MLSLPLLIYTRLFIRAFPLCVLFIWVINHCPSPVSFGFQVSWFWDLQWIPSRLVMTGGRKWKNVRSQRIDILCTDHTMVKLILHDVSVNFLFKVLMFQQEYMEMCFHGNQPRCGIKHPITSHKYDIFEWWSNQRNFCIYLYINNCSSSSV